MKITLKIFLIVLGVMLTISMAFTAYYLSVTADAKIDLNKLIGTEQSVSIYDKNDNLIANQSKNVELIDIKILPAHVKNAFVAIEDKRFYEHNGVDYKGIFRAIFNNLKSFSFKEGASTITQQLIKNSYLSSEKTLKRKLIEFKLAKDLEKRLSKDEILGTYLNTIYFGDGCYGICKAAKHYFGKSPQELSIGDGATLAGIVKSPANYSPTLNYDNSSKRRNVVLSAMLDQKYITETEFIKYSKETLNLSNFSTKSGYGYDYLLNSEINEFINKYGAYGKKYKIYTYLDQNIQNKCEEIVTSNKTDHNETVMVCDNKSHVISYYSTCKKQNRQIGSTIKPLVVYAPAIELNTIDECTMILDEKTDFSGYSPSNYNDVYYGNISAKSALSKSLNVCAVKVLNSTGIEKSVNYIKKTDIKICDDDKNLALALGATKYGATLDQVVSAYSVFNCNGYYHPAICIKKITDENGNILFKNQDFAKKIFSEDTISIVNDMTRDVIEEGTLKKLSFANAYLYGKSGTVGNKNGNTDAYCISYNKDYIMGTWIGSDKNLLPNTITGGTLPSTHSLYLWNEIYPQNNQEKIPLSNKIKSIKIDRISYEKNGDVFIADKYAPKKYVSEWLFKENHVPNTVSKIFSNPKCEDIKISEKIYGFQIELCLSELYDYKVYRDDGHFKKLIYDSKNNGKNFSIVDYDISTGKTFVYSVLPYFVSGDNIIYGEEMFSKKIKSSIKITDDDWIELLN